MCFRYMGLLTSAASIYIGMLSIVKDNIVFRINVEAKKDLGWRPHINPHKVYGRSPK